LTLAWIKGVRKTYVAPITLFLLINAIGMNTEAGDLLIAALIGCRATAFLDLWSLFLRLAFRAPCPTSAWSSRWFSHMSKAGYQGMHPLRLPHRCIPNARSAGSPTYVIGAFNGLAIVSVRIRRLGLAKPTIMPALIIGLVTVLPAIPHHATRVRAWPCGIPSTQSMHARIRTLLSHTVFGIGLYDCAIGIGCLL
jgi:hypothetical protein